MISLLVKIVFMSKVLGFVAMRCKDVEESKRNSEPDSVWFCVITHPHKPSNKNLVYKCLFDY